MSSKRLSLDFETFSEVDLRDVGAYRYAADKSTCVLCCAFAFEDTEPKVWHPGLDEIDLWGIEPYLEALRDPSVLVTAHNCMFEYAILQFHSMKLWSIPAPDVSRLRCTMSLARRASLPSKLEKLAEVLDLPHKKDARGKSLLRKFSMMQPPKKPTKAHPNGLPTRRILPSDEPEAFKELLEYCLQDVRVEKLVQQKLKYFDEPINNRNYVLDQRINARGVPVNLAALRHAQKLIDEETEIVSAQFRELTGFEVTQRDVFLAWLHSQGCHLDNLQAETIETFLDEYEGGDAPCPSTAQSVDNTTSPDNALVGCNGEPKFDPSVSPAITALRLKQSIAYASIKKVQTMLDCAGPHDNRLRGMLSHHAATTGRWASNLVQLQNLKRPTIKHSEAAYREIENGISREMLECCYGSVLEVISSSVRHFIHDSAEGVEQPFLDADFSAIEARIVCWLAGQEDALEEYRQGIDRYSAMASLIYRIPVEKVNRHPQRFVGKQTVLGCGFQMSPDKFRKTCLKMGRYELPEGLEFIAVQAFRTKHKKIVQLWYETERAMQAAITRKGEAFRAGKHLLFIVKDIEGMPFMLMRLPSGRKLAYPQPKLVPSRRFADKLEVTFFGNIKGATWGRVSTYGASAVENATQAVAADIMTNGAHNAEQENYPIAMLVHDQAIAFQTNGQTPERFVELLTRLPSWADGLPIAAEGAVVPFYRKE